MRSPPISADAENDRFHWRQPGRLLDRCRLKKKVERGLAAAPGGGSEETKSQHTEAQAGIVKVPARIAGLARAC
jgi:hypothetical protein